MVDQFLDKISQTGPCVIHVQVSSWTKADKTDKTFIQRAYEAEKRLTGAGIAVAIAIEARDAPHNICSSVVDPDEARLFWVPLLSSPLMCGHRHHTRDEDGRKQVKTHVHSTVVSSVPLCKAMIEFLLPRAIRSVSLQDQRTLTARDARRAENDEYIGGMRNPQPQDKSKTSTLVTAIIDVAT